MKSFYQIQIFLYWLEGAILLDFYKYTMFVSGTEKHHRYISIGSIYDPLGVTKASALPHVMLLHELISLAGLQVKANPNMLEIL